jgi:hypothetical protein
MKAVTLSSVAERVGLTPSAVSAVPTTLQLRIPCPNIRRDAL